MNPQAQIITLTTDFGTDDWFVGTMKGILLAINPRATLVDLTHEIPPGDIRAGAFALAAACRYFSEGTVHLAVVDPGVGSARGAIAVQTGGHFFVGPDNGLFSWAISREPLRSIRSLEDPRYFIKPLSRTFHGRDIFAPVAAHLSRGLAINRLGPARRDIVQLKWPKPEPFQSGVRGEILYLDRFGNALTNIDMPALRNLGPGPLEVLIGRKRLCPVSEFYQSVGPGRPVAVLGSSGFLEIAVNGGSAAKRLGLGVGDIIIVRAGS